jgi:hypothetical protein
MEKLKYKHLVLIVISMVFSFNASADYPQGPTEGSENDGFVNEVVVEVPEPSIIALFGIGLVGLGFARRRARQT